MARIEHAKVVTAKAATATLSTYLLGRSLDEVERREHDWVFTFGEQISLTLSCPWRIVAADRIALSDSDDGQQFGLPAPLEGVREVKRLLAERRITDVTIHDATGDLSIVIDGDTTVEALNMSSGYEAWQADLPDSSIIAMGGGQIATVPRASFR